MKTTQPIAAGEAAHKRIVPMLEIRGLPGSSSGFLVGYWCRREWEDINPGHSKVITIPDPKGDSWENVCEIPGMGKASDNRALAEFFVRACNSHENVCNLLRRCESFVNEDLAKEIRQALRNL